MKRTFIAALLGTFLLNHTPATASQYMGRTNEGDTLILNYVDMEYAVFPGYGKTIGFNFSIYDPNHRSVDAKVNTKSCKNGRYFIPQEDGTDRKIQAESAAARTMLTTVCNVLNGKLSVEYLDGNQIYVPTRR